MNGILIVDKEKNCTSRDVVNIACNVLKTKKVGHTGTLDPLATGVLVLTVGKATKLVDVLASTKKEYIAEVKLGIATDTLDITGNVLKIESVDIKSSKIKEALHAFQKTYLQEVPIYSAVKVNGKKLYEYARNKEEVILPKKEVTIYELELLGDIVRIDGSVQFTMRAVVSKGTYIRSLIRDIAAYLGTVGVMKNLRRTKQGMFDLKEAISMKALEKGEISLLPIASVLPDLEPVILNEAYEKQVRNGAKITYESSCEYLMFYGSDGLEVALYQKAPDGYRLKIMF